MNKTGDKNGALELVPNWFTSSTDQIDKIQLLGLEDALDRSWLRKGSSRNDFATDVLKCANKSAALIILAMLPKKWKAKPAILPEQLRGIATLLEGELMNPALLVALADDLNHLWPANNLEKCESALTRWCNRTVRYKRHDLQLPRNIAELNEIAGYATKKFEHAKKGYINKKYMGPLGIGIEWQNIGLEYSQTEQERLKNRILAQVLNALAANQQNEDEAANTRGAENFIFEGEQTTRGLVERLASNGWKCKGRFRSSVASFGLGACCQNEEKPNQWTQIPLAVPYRTRILYKGEEIRALFPHSSFELELEPPNKDGNFLIQYYQGTEGLNGWAALNDLHRPWQNDRENGTVKYSGKLLSMEELSEAIDLSDVIARIHNNKSSQMNLRYGGYGSMGFCIDSTGLLEFAISGNTNQFPLTLNGVWRERLDNLAKQIAERIKQPLDKTYTAIERYREALEKIPCDIDIRRKEKNNALQRLCNSQPRESPFKTIQKIKDIESEIAKIRKIL